MTLEQVVACIFRKKGKLIAISEFVFALSLDLKWFSPDQAESLLKRAESESLVRIIDDMVEPMFDIHEIEIPIDFRPDQSVFGERTILDQVIARLSDKLDEQEIIRRISGEEDRLGIVEEDAAALLVARTLGTDVDDLIDRAYDRLMNRNTNV